MSATAVHPLGLRRLAAVTLTLALLLASLATGPGTGRVSVVATTSGSLAAVVDDVRALGGEVTAVLDEFGILTAELPADSVGTLSGLVEHLTFDRDLRPAGRPTVDGTPSTTAAASVGAAALHADGVTGTGVGIAIVDTGVEPVGPIRDQLVAGANVIGPAHGDGYGHGTFLAGVITGDGAGTAGVAPDAHLVSVRVAGDDGSTSLSAVLTGLAVVHAAAEQFDVRVALLAFGVEPSEVDVPLARALEALWAEGLTVVVPAGNGGPTAGTLTAPGVNPYLLVVGASDDQGTADTSDDTLLSASGRGPTAARTGPDLLAPGVSLQSLRAPGSLIDRTHRDARVGAQGFRGSGTSMAAAVAAGAAALLLDAEPGLTPDEVKGRLIAGAEPISADVNGAGAGLLDVATASTMTSTANGDLPALPAPTWPEPTEGADNAPELWSWMGSNWAGSNWAGSNWAGSNWAGSNWAGSNWAGSNWAAAWGQSP